MLGRLKPRHEPLAEIKPHVCRGVGTVEVPRGTLWHEYELDDTGHVTQANIITPTAQNLRSIEDDIKLYLPQIIDLPQAEMTDALEKLIRSYDPCLSCAAHFLKSGVAISFRTWSFTSVIALPIGRAMIGIATP